MEIVAEKLFTAWFQLAFVSGIVIAAVSIAVLLVARNIEKIEGTE